jgi:uncharacterized repeat protein (TIGR03803 family)
MFVLLSLLLVAVPRLTQAQTESVIYSFCAKTGCSDGANPNTSLLLDAKGNIYGTTYGGGSSGCAGRGCGTVFEVNASGVETVLYSFTGQTGQNPSSGLVRGPKGILSGTTSLGGTSNNGTVFQLIKTGKTAKETVLYSFTGGSDGGLPGGNLVLDAQGNLYGTTASGGLAFCAIGFPAGCGTVFEVGPTGAEKVLYTFPGNGEYSEPDGAAPYTGVIWDARHLYGTTPYGGANGFGTVFEVSAPGKEKVLHSFRDRTDGGLPSAGLIRDAEGNLYGTTRDGGALNIGTVFKLTKKGELTALYSFKGSPSDGAQPVAGLVMDKQGNLYGTTFEGGAYGNGTVFELSPSGSETVLYSFTGGTDGSAPGASLVLDKQGNLYGTTPAGGAYGYGTLFKVVP